MSKINPLYIIVLLVFVILVLYIKISFKQDDIGVVGYAIEKTQQVGSYYNDLKNEFGNKQKTVKTLDNILQSYGLLKPPHSFNVNKRDIVIELKNIDTKTTNKVVSKILNTSVIVSSFNMKDVDFNKTIKIKILF